MAMERDRAGAMAAEAREWRRSGRMYGLEDGVVELEAAVVERA
jgi:hypothetical protein